MRYKVKISKLIINEMARYDNATIIEMTQVKDERLEKLKERYPDDPYQYEHFIKYDAVLESDQCTLPRWFSFGVHPVMLENNDG